MARVSISLLVLATLYLPTTLARGDDDVFHSTLLYDWGFYGLHPKTWYKSFKQPSPLLNFRAWDDRCDDGYYLLSPRGTTVSKPGPLIVDGRGHLVWTLDIYGETTVVKAKTYRGKGYLTFWAGIDGVIFRYDRGTYYIGWILENFFQEVDIETGKLLFEWKASGHVPVSETPGGALDSFHINSVDKDADGNYIISARHTHTVMCISPKGETLWALGGKSNTFQDLSDSWAVDFTWQHDARLHDNNTLSIFNNGKSELKDYVAEYSRGILVGLDTDHMTATLLRVLGDLKRSKLAQLQGFRAGYREHRELARGLRIPPNLHGIRRKRSDDRWILEDAYWKGVDGNDYIQPETKKKDAFEVSFAIECTMPPFLRVVAIDRDGRILGHTDVLHRESGNAPSTKLRNWLFRGGVVPVILAVTLVFRKRIKRTLKSGAVTKAASFMRKGWWQDRRTVSRHEAQRLYNG
ncbi:hypothetical protein DL766_007834 [Monosporascus sp. MC13-8B]|uniref:Uncharacterized protein n=1 Tax=Monosporascus cannonballus TaxID=155416 RepID=A0ABY0GY91_9PEZI|nr:hypothetical protein DL762_007739 [Monosporascus cannonballus]RYO90084.1 hypothetical protein DL763_005451 [Monosporascus cannonballus]RYP21939.1 hypothetical protein DL766_007834 [Monosporascus sp. MC13-8B]